MHGPIARNCKKCVYDTVCKKTKYSNIFCDDYSEEIPITVKPITIYNMVLHQEIFIGFFSIVRVPGGWIYRTNRDGSDVFVPFHNEFQKGE